MADSTVSAKGNPVALPLEASDKALVLPEGAEDNTLVLRCVRDAIDESGWKYEAVAAAMSATASRSIDGPYLSKMLVGEKPFGAELLRALPDDIETIVARRYTEAMGLIVVKPVHGDAAVHALVSGLVGMLRPQAPLRMAKATLPAIRRKVAR